jgi:hypothetical protein
MTKLNAGIAFSESPSDDGSGFITLVLDGLHQPRYAADLWTPGKII